MNWGVTPLIATRTVAADAGTLHHFLADPANQLRLAGQAPRDVDVRVQPKASGRVLSVEVSRGRRTALWVTWILSAGRGTTDVDVALQFETRGLATRLALVLGGRRRLARRVDDALARLAQVCARAAEDVVAESPSPCPDRSRRRRSARGADRATTGPR